MLAVGQTSVGDVGLWLIDGSNLEHPSVLYSWTLPFENKPNRVAAALDGDTILLLLHYPNGSGAQTSEFDGRDLNRYAVRADGSLELERAFSVGASGDILAFDGRLAWLSTPDGLSIVDTATDSTERQISTLELPQEALSITPYGPEGPMLIAHPNGVSVVEPPCLGP